MQLIRQQTIAQDGSYTTRLFGYCAHCGKEVPISSEQQVEIGYWQMVLHKECRYPYWLARAEAHARTQEARKRHPWLTWILRKVRYIKD